MAMKNVTPVEMLPETLQKKGGRGNTAHGEERYQNGLHLVPTRTDAELEADIDKRAAGRRIQYKPMRLHQEKAAMGLAAGWTRRKSAKYAGISPRQIGKYMQSADFRERITEHRQVMMSQIQGQLIKEIGKRVSPGKIATLEPLDIVRFYNLTTGGKDKGLDAGSTQIKYDIIFNSITAQITDPNTGNQGGDFPEYGSEDFLLPGGDSSGD